MNEYQLSKLADLQEEDAIGWDDLEEMPTEEEDEGKRFKDKYLEFYDDIKTSPRDDW